MILKALPYLSGPSNIHGIGVFAHADLQEGEEYVRVRAGDPEFRGFNHSDTPNLKLAENVGENRRVVMLKSVLAGQELTVNYRDPGPEIKQ